VSKVINITLGGSAAAANDGSRLKRHRIQVRRIKEKGA